MVSDLLQAGPDCAHALIWCANQCACPIFLHLCRLSIHAVSAFHPPLSFPLLRLSTRPPSSVLLLRGVHASGSPNIRPHHVATAR